MTIRDELRGLNADKLRELVGTLDDELRTLNADEAGEIRQLNDDEQKTFDEKLSLRSDAAALLERHNKLAALPASARVSGDGARSPEVIVRDDPYDLNEVRFSPFEDSQVRTATIRDRALRAIDQDRTGLTAEQRSHVETLVRRLPEAAERVLVTGSPQYRAAFSKLWDAMVRGRMPILTAEDNAALQRAASLTDNAGGYAIPFTLDPTVISTQAQTTNPFRRISRQVTINTNQWNGVTSGGIIVSWDGEAGEVSDDTPTLGQPSINVWKAQGFVPFSIEIGQDWSGFEAEMRTEFGRARDNAEATAFATGAGDGSHTPTGIVTALTGGGQVVTSATTDTFAIADVYSVYEKPTSPWWENGSWLAHRKIYDKVRQFATANNYHAFWTTLGGGLPSLLLDRPVYESSAMDGTIDASAENYAMVYGDFSNYLIVDRIGLQVELVPHLFATANNRPSGQRGLYCWWRVGADSVNDSAFALLNVT